ncbi:MAG: extracellular solute-binding protein [Gemmataceae bacterium]|nr:extracellular solute-binding protein [Gemmataceae bacterium]MCI0740916.1 extracellular solute-binding protein [Gemmataceae bacterium]
MIPKACVVLVLAGLLAGCSRSGSSAVAPAEVVVYASVDDVFSRPIVEKFEKDTGIKAKLVVDTEETKSTGLVNRLIAEKNRPQADVFWCGDPVRAALLKSKGVTAPYKSPQLEGMPLDFTDKEHHWIGFSARARIIIYNTNLVAKGEEPASVLDLLDARFKGKACMANPLFGTTSMHATALFAKLGDEKATNFFDGFSANGGKMLSSNGEVRRRVVNGEYAVGLTDTDDYNEAREEKKPVGAVYADAKGMGTVIVPNAVMMINGGPNPELGKKFIDYLLNPETEKALAESGAAQMPVRPGVPVPAHVTPLDKLTPMPLDYPQLAERLLKLADGYLDEWARKNAK